MRTRDEPPDPGRRTCAALDIISDGRLEVGTARSSTWTELGGFNVDPDDTKKTWDEFVRALPKLWADGHTSWEGSAFSMPERNVLPKPVQKPHPPMWVTVTSPGTECDAADRGLGCLGVAAAGYAEQERRTAEYFRRIELCDPVSGLVTREVTTLNFLFCHEDPATAAAVGMGMVGGFGLANSHLLWTREAYPDPRLPVARQPRSRRRQAVVGWAGRRVRHPRRHLRRRSRHHRGGDRALGVRRRHGDQLPAERDRDDPAAPGAREHAPLRREVMPRFASR